MYNIDLYLSIYLSIYISLSLSLYVYIYIYTYIHRYAPVGAKPPAHVAGHPPGPELLAYINTIYRNSNKANTYKST